MSRVRDGLDGLLAGSSAARRALHQEPHGVFERVESVFRETFSYALANATWILFGLAIMGAVLAWAFVQSAPTAAAASGTGEAEHHQHHCRFHF